MLTRLFLLLSLVTATAHAQDALLTNTEGRKSVSLNGTWHYIVDTYETGFYDYRFQERKEDDKGAYWNRTDLADKSALIEQSFDNNDTLHVPGDWNSQDRQFLHYEGTVWYQRYFDKPQIKDGETFYLYFGAANYEAHIYLNGKKLGMHKGGFTAFNFKVPQGLLKDKDNFLVVKVDNKRHADEIPTLNTDWWNYGGITRDVKLVIVPSHFILQSAIELDTKQNIVLASKNKTYEITGFVKLDAVPSTATSIKVEIPELKFKQEITATSDSIPFHFKLKKLALWSPENPKLYNVSISTTSDRLSEKIGFRKIEVEGKKIILNGKPIFLRGICIHEEIPQQIRRAYSKKDALQLLGWAKELGVNMVRLAHYPHNENMVKTADSLGLMVWSEIPVYWTVNFKSASVLARAKKQLQEMIARDRNRASVIIWSVGNETPISPERTAFMSALVAEAKKTDRSRLISAALEANRKGFHSIIDDPLGAVVDIVSVNEYLGWYVGHPDDCREATWELAYDKPLFISETGADAKGGFHDAKETRFSEEYQQWYYEEQIAMFGRLPDNFSGLSPWILVDFRSPRRNNPVYQELWNRKGLIDDKGNKKKAFFVLQEYYRKLKAAGK